MINFKKGIVKSFSYIKNGKPINVKKHNRTYSDILSGITSGVSAAGALSAIAYLNKNKIARLLKPNVVNNIKNEIVNNPSPINVNISNVEKQLKNVAQELKPTQKIRLSRKVKSKTRVPKESITVAEKLAEIPEVLEEVRKPIRQKLPLADVKEPVITQSNAPKKSKILENYTKERNRLQGVIDKVDSELNNISTRVGQKEELLVENFQAVDEIVNGIKTYNKQLEILKTKGTVVDPKTGKKFTKIEDLQLHHRTNSDYGNEVIDLNKERQRYEDLYSIGNKEKELYPQILEDFNRGEELRAIRKAKYAEMETLWDNFDSTLPKINIKKSNKNVFTGLSPELLKVEKELGISAKERQRLALKMQNATYKTDGINVYRKTGIGSDAVIEEVAPAKNYAETLDPTIENRLITVNEKVKQIYPFSVAKLQDQQTIGRQLAAYRAKTIKGLKEYKNLQSSRKLLENAKKSGKTSDIELVRDNIKLDRQNLYLELLNRQRKGEFKSINNYISFKNNMTTTFLSDYQSADFINLPFNVVNRGVAALGKGLIKSTTVSSGIRASGSAIGTKLANVGKGIASGFKTVNNATKIPNLGISNKLNSVGNKIRNQTIKNGIKVSPEYRNAGLSNRDLARANGTDIGSKLANVTQGFKSKISSIKTNNATKNLSNIKTANPNLQIKPPKPAKYKYIDGNQALGTYKPKSQLPAPITPRKAAVSRAKQDRINATNKMNSYKFKAKSHYNYF